MPWLISFSLDLLGMNELSYQITLPIVLALEVIYFVIVYRAYRRTKFIGFALWGIAVVVGFCNGLAWHIIGHGHRYPSLFDRAAAMYRVIHILTSLIALWGTVLVIREFLRRVGANKV
jgi:hypothetical protein